MRKLATHFVVMIIVMQTILACAQMSGNQEPGFTLSLKEEGRIGPGYHTLIVTLTNTSKEIMHRTVCDSWGDMYNLEVVYNGIPVEKTEAEKERRKQLESGDCFGGGGSARAEHTKPGESREDIRYYFTTKPGIYEIIATRETFPGHPEKSVTVKSNAITIVVPESPLKLTLSENHDLGAGLDRVNVTETNISDKDFIDQDNGCIRELGWFTVEVFYNGVQLEEKDVKARFRRENETTDLMNQRKAPCATEPTDIVIKPGKSRKLWLGVSDIYDVTKPGSYDVYVSRETDPIGLIKSEYVRSNTITIEVP
jgi:hypothetical protein